jgi:hypothetical protein
MFVCLLSMQKNAETTRPEKAAASNHPMLRCSDGDGSICSVRISFPSRLADPLLSARIVDSQNLTIVSPKSAKRCGTRQFAEETFMLTYCLTFTLPQMREGQQQRKFLLNVRVEYTSKQAALKDYVSACGGEIDPNPGEICSWKNYTKGVANDVFLGKPVKGSPFTMVQVSGQLESGVLGSCGAEDKLSSGNWVRGGNEGGIGSSRGSGGSGSIAQEGQVRPMKDHSSAHASAHASVHASAHANEELTCVEFYMPDILKTAFHRSGIRISTTQSHEALNQGYSMSIALTPVDAQVELVWRMPAVQGKLKLVLQKQSGLTEARLRERVVKYVQRLLAQQQRRQQQQQGGGERGGEGGGGSGGYEWQWRWEPHSCSMERMTRGLLQSFGGDSSGSTSGSSNIVFDLATQQRVGQTHITFLTDSVGRYTYHYLRCALKQGKQWAPTEKDMLPSGGDAAGGELNFDLVSHIPFKGFEVPEPLFWRMALKTLLYETTARAQARALKGFAEEHGEVLVLNSGLWDANYGRIGVYEANIGTMLWQLSTPFSAEQVAQIASRTSTSTSTSMSRRGTRTLPGYGFRRILWVSTSAVHPIKFGGLKRMPAKHYLNEPRVEALNAVALAAIHTHNKKVDTEMEGGIQGKQGRAHRPKVEIVDNWAMTIGREDDPLTPQDMRHFGGSTVHAMAQALLHQLHHR